MQNKKKKHHHSFSPFQNGKNSFDFDRFVIGDKMSVRASVCVCGCGVRVCWAVA